MGIEKRAIIGFICDNYNISESDIDGNTDLFSSGILDSFSMLDLVSFVEKTAGIRFGVLDLNLDNISTIDRILNYIARKAR